MLPPATPIVQLFWRCLMTASGPPSCSCFGMFWLAAGATPIHSPRATTTIRRILIFPRVVQYWHPSGPPRNPRQALGRRSRTQVLGLRVPFLSQRDVGLYGALGAHLLEHSGIVGFRERECGRRIASFRRALKHQPGCNDI